MDMDMPIAQPTRPSTPSFRMLVPRMIDRNDHRTLFEMVREYKFVPADTCSAMVIHSDVHRAVNNIIRDGDFRIMTCKMIHEQVSLMVPRQSMLRYDSEIDRYIQYSLRMTIWTGIPKRSLRQSDGQVDEDKTEPEKKLKKSCGWLHHSIRASAIPTRYGSSKVQLAQVAHRLKNADL